MNTGKLANCNDISDNLFNNIYDRLYDEAKKENNALYNSAIAKCKTKKQIDKKAGCYSGEWQKLFDQWLIGKIPNTFILDCLDKGYIDTGLLN